MNAIWKYHLQIGNESQVRMLPEGAVVVHVAVQNGLLTLWMLCDPILAARERRVFRVVGTGQQTDGVYCGTVHVPPFVWHVFEESPS